MQKIIKELIEELEKRGVRKNTIECILQEGSSLYLTNPNDLDFKVVVSHYNPKAETHKPIIIDNKKIECCFYTFKDWERVTSYKKAYFIVESQDMICVYGDGSKFKRYNVLEDIKLQKYVLDIYDKYLFNVTNNKIKPFGKKRLWNFLLFAYRIKNNSRELIPAQIDMMQKAHDLKLEVIEVKPLFDSLKNIIINRVESLA